MKTSRKQIRDAIQAQIQDVAPSIQVFTKRFVDGTGFNDFITVYLSSGEVEWNGINAHTSAILSIGIYGNLNSGDDQLDAIGDVIQAELEKDCHLGGLIQGMTFSGFEYPMDDEPHFNQLILNYSLQY